MALSDFPRYPLTFGPSPVHRLERLTAHLGGATIWAKREDCNSGLAYGGNKTRKLEYLVPDAIAKGADTLVSIGGYQSNHTRQVAAVAARIGMRCVLVQEKWVDWPDVVNDRVGNILLSRIMGADVRLDEAGFDIGFRDSWRQAIVDVEAAGGTPYPIPAGASDHPLGGLGFAHWAQEVEQQERELGVFFDTVVVCTVTGSTHAGMIAGFARQDRPRRVIGIDASATLDKTRDQVARIARHTAELVGLGRDLREDEITVLEGWAGDLYGIPVQSDARCDPADRPARGHDHRPGLRGEVDGRPDRSGARRRHRARLARALRTPRRAARTQRLLGSVHPHRTTRRLTDPAGALARQSVRTVSRSPGWQSSTWQIAVSVLNRTARARPFFSTDRLTTVTPARSASSASVMPRSARSLSRCTSTAWSSSGSGVISRALFLIRWRRSRAASGTDSRPSPGRR